MAASAITVYIIRLIIAVAPPKAHATKSNSNNPTSPQFNPPIMASIRHILSNIFSPLLH